MHAYNLPGSQKRVTNPLELKMLIVVSHHVHGTELWSSATVASALNLWTIYPDPGVYFLDVLTVSLCSVWYLIRCLWPSSHKQNHIPLKRQEQHSFEEALFFTAPLNPCSLNSESNNYRGFQIPGGNCGNIAVGEMQKAWRLAQDGCKNKSNAKQASRNSGSPLYSLEWCYRLYDFQCGKRCGALSTLPRGLPVNFKPADW